MTTTARHKTQLLFHIAHLLEEAGVKPADIKVRIEELRKESTAALNDNIGILEAHMINSSTGKEILSTADYRLAKKLDRIKIQSKTKLNKGVKKMGNLTIKKKESTSKMEKMQSTLEELKKLNGKELVEVGAEGVFMGTKFEVVEVNPKLCTGDKLRMVAYSIQNAMGLGNAKTKEAQAGLT